MTRADIEYTLMKSGAVKAGKNRWRHDKHPYQSIRLGWKYVKFIYPLYDGDEYLYSEITPELWTELTGLKFHRRKK